MGWFRGISSWPASLSRVVEDDKERLWYGNVVYVVHSVMGRDQKSFCRGPVCCIDGLKGRGIMPWHLY